MPPPTPGPPSSPDFSSRSRPPVRHTYRPLGGLSRAPPASARWMDTSREEGQAEADAKTVGDKGETKGTRGGRKESAKAVAKPIIAGSVVKAPALVPASRRPLAPKVNAQPPLATKPMAPALAAKKASLPPPVVKKEPWIPAAVFSPAKPRPFPSSKASTKPTTGKNPRASAFSVYADPKTVLARPTTPSPPAPSYFEFEAGIGSPAPKGKASPEAGDGGEEMRDVDVSEMEVDGGLDEAMELEELGTEEEVCVDVAGSRGAQVRAGSAALSMHRDESHPYSRSSSPDPLSVPVCTVSLNPAGDQVMHVRGGGSVEKSEKVGKVSKGEKGGRAKVKSEKPREDRSSSPDPLAG